MLAANCFHKLNCCTHHSINHLADNIFGKFSCGPNFGDHQSQQSLHGLQQGQVPRLLAAGMKETAGGPLVGIQPLPEREEHIADHDHGCMADHLLMSVELWAVIVHHGTLDNFFQGNNIKVVLQGRKQKFEFLLPVV